MASTDSRPVPIKNTAFRAVFAIYDADGDVVTGATGLDSEVSKDQGTFADCSNEATEIATASGIYYLDLTSTEMNADCTAVIVKTTTVGAKSTLLVFYPQESGDIKVDVQSLLGTAWLTPGTAGTPDVNAKLWNGLTTVALPLVPTTAGRTLDVTAANKVNGVVLVDTLTTYTGNTPQTGDSFARIGAAGAGLTNIDLPNQTMDIVGNLTGNLSGSVGSVTGAVGSVTGAVGSVTGAVGSVTAGVTVTTNNDKSSYRLSATGVDDVLDDTIGDGTITMRQALRVLIAGMAGKLSGAATTTVTIRNLADSADVVVATVDASGNRSAVTVTP